MLNPRFCPIILINNSTLSCSYKNLIHKMKMLHISSMLLYITHINSMGSNQMTFMSRIGHVYTWRKSSCSTCSSRYHNIMNIYLTTNGHHIFLVFQTFSSGYYTSVTSLINNEQCTSDVQVNQQKNLKTIIKSFMIPLLYSN